MKIKIENKLYSIAKSISEKEKSNDIFMISKKDEDLPTEKLLDKVKKFQYKRQSFNKDRFEKGCEKKKHKNFWYECNACEFCHNNENLSSETFYISKKKYYNIYNICKDCIDLKKIFYNINEICS